MEIEINAAVPVLRVVNVGQTMAWYAEHLGFTADPFPAQAPYEFAILEAGQTRIMVRRATDYARDASTKGWDVYVSLGGGKIREVYARLREQVRIARPLQRMPYGDAEFDIVDPDGYVLCLSELLANADDLPQVAA